MTIRFMNTKGKIKILKHFKEECKNGSVDISLIPFLRKLNKIDGIVTTESCEGHSRNDGKTCSYGTAVLFIWPSKKMAEKFREKASKLASAPRIERVSNYSNDTWDKEVICITFARNTIEKKKDHNKAKKVILSFFRQLEVEIGGK